LKSIAFIDETAKKTGRVVQVGLSSEHFATCSIDAFKKTGRGKRKRLEESQNETFVSDTAKKTGGKLCRWLTSSTLQMGRRASGLNTPSYTTAPVMLKFKS
jgi:hypothetical protein